MSGEQCERMADDIDETEAAMFTALIHADEDDDDDLFCELWMGLMDRVVLHEQQVHNERNPSALLTDVAGLGSNITADLADSFIAVIDSYEEMLNDSRTNMALEPLDWRARWQSYLVQAELEDIELE